MSWRSKQTHWDGGLFLPAHRERTLSLAIQPLPGLEPLMAAPPYQAKVGQEPTNVATAQDWVALAEWAKIPSLQQDSGLEQQLQQAQKKEIQALIVLGFDDEPMLTARWRLMVEKLDAILETASSLATAFEIPRRHLAVEPMGHSQIRQWRSAAGRHQLSLDVLDGRYPESAVNLLTLDVTGRVVPAGGRPEDVGVLVIEPELLWALCQARRGQAMTERVVTVTGSAVQRAGNYRIALGTAFSEVLRRAGLANAAVRVIEGGLLRGRAVDRLDATVSARTSAIIVLDANADYIADPGPCVQCGWCQEDCPVGLDPRSLLDTIERNGLESSESQHPEACIECGLCSYVCPAELPLAENIVAARRMILERRPGDR